MATFGKGVEFKRELTTIYIDDGTPLETWLEEGSWIGPLYGEFLYSAKQIVYHGESDIPLANIVSETTTSDMIEGLDVHITINTELVLSRETLLERLEMVLYWAEDMEYYEDCACLRDMIIEFKNGQLISNRGSL